MLTPNPFVFGALTLFFLGLASCTPDKNSDSPAGASPTVKIIDELNIGKPVLAGEEANFLALNADVTALSTLTFDQIQNVPDNTQFTISTKCEAANGEREWQGPAQEKWMIVDLLPDSVLWKLSLLETEVICQFDVLAQNAMGSTHRLSLSNVKIVPTHSTSEIKLRSSTPPSLIDGREQYNASQFFQLQAVSPQKSSRRLFMICDETSIAEIPLTVLSSSALFNAILQITRQEEKVKWACVLVERGQKTLFSLPFTLLSPPPPLEVRNFEVDLNSNTHAFVGRQTALRMDVHNPHSVPVRFVLDRYNNASVELTPVYFGPSTGGRPNQDLFNGNTWKQPLQVTLVGHSKLETANNYTIVEIAPGQTVRVWSFFEAKISCPSYWDINGPYFLYGFWIRHHTPLRIFQVYQEEKVSTLADQISDAQLMNMAIAPPTHHPLSIQKEHWVRWQEVPNLGYLRDQFMATKFVPQTNLRVVEVCHSK